MSSQESFQLEASTSSLIEREDETDFGEDRVDGRPLRDSRSVRPGADESSRISPPPHGWKAGEISIIDGKGNPTDPKKYLRIPEEAVTRNLDDLVEYIIGGWNLQKPKILINVMGDLDHSRFSPECLKSVIKSLFRMTKNTCLFTEGIRTSVNGYVGRGIQELCLECNQIENEECNVSVTSLGICSWNYIVENQYLEENNTHFLGIEGENVEGDTIRKELLKRILVPRTNLLIGGGPKTIDTLAELLQENIPCILVKGSGGAADRLASVVKLLRSSSTPVNDTVIDAILAQTEEPDAKGKFRRCVLKYEDLEICDAANFQEAEIQKILLKGHMSFMEKEKKKKKVNVASMENTDARPMNPHCDILELCQSWNASDIATEWITRFKIKLKDYTEVEQRYFIRSSLEVGSVSFVLFFMKQIKSGFKLLRREDFKLLYDSDKISLRTAKSFCRSEAEDMHGINRVGEEIKSLVEDEIRDLPDNFDPQFHLFIWALLFKHYELAEILWNILDFPVANGLIANSVLHAVMKLGFSDADSNAKRVLEANKYEERASLLISKCHDRSPIRTKFLLIRKMKQRGNLSCLELATKDDVNANFLTTPSVMRHLDDIWWKCGRGDTTQLLINLVVGATFMLSLSILTAGVFFSRMRVNVVSFTIAGFVFFVTLVSLVQSFKVKAYRVPYKSLRPVDESDEEEDLKQLKSVTKDEAASLLDVGIPLDLIYEENMKKEKEEERENENRGHSLNKRWCHFVTEFLTFLDVPQFKFVLYVGSFLVYLLLFMFLILSAPSSFALTPLSSTEIVIYLYWFSFFAQEVKQFYRGDVKKMVATRSMHSSLKRKFSVYFDSIWNRMDVVIFASIVSGIIYRSVIYYKGESETIESPPETRWILNFYSILFVMGCLRLLQLFAVNQTLGPKLIMIRLMIDDVLQIMLYVMIFAFAYGVWVMVTVRTVSKEFLLGSGNNSTTNATETIVDSFKKMEGTDVVYFLDELMSHPFWHLFGEGYLHSYENYLPRRNETNDYAYRYRVSMIKFFVPLMRLIYMLITVVLLLNLMINIFQYSIEPVQNQANRNWNIYRKGVIFEYHNRAILPAPASLVCDVFAMLSWLYRKIRGSAFHFSYLKKGDRFRCTLLSFRLYGGFEGGENPFAGWLEYICKWEKLLQKKHLLLGSSAAGVVGKPVGRFQASDATKIVEVKEEIKKLSELCRNGENPKQCAKKGRKEGRKK